MKMHSPKFKDPLISRPEPVTLLTPVIEEALKLAGVPPNRDHVIDRFMSGAPRIAVVRGSDDHPPAIGSKETVRRLTRLIWLAGGLPFEVTQSFPCEELSHATEGAQYALLSRNLCTAAMASHIEEHGYDAVIIMGACDKMMVGNMRALVEADLSRQKRRARPIFAMLIPSLIGREVFASEEDKRRFEPLKARLPEVERRELDDLLRRPIKPDVYGHIKLLLDRCFHRRMVQESEKDDLEHCLAKCASVPGGSCGATEASIVHRLMLASFGLVPRHCDILVKSPADEHLAEIVKRLLSAIQKRERRVSVASLTRSNLINACAVWSATGGHPAWLLHLSYLADAIGKTLTMEDVTRKVRTVPQILAIDDSTGNSAYMMGVETENGGNSGIDTIMRTLAEKRLVEDRAVTFDGSWMQRIMEARSANGNFLYSTMTPYLRTCGLVPVHGNMCSGAVARVSLRQQSIEPFDKKLYLAVYYLGVKDLHSDLISNDGVFERLKRKIDRDDLYYTWLFNWGHDSENGLAEWNRNRLWDFLIREGTLRLMIVVAGAGPRAAGMPQIQLYCPSMPNLSSIAAVVTDGRVSFQHDGISISHLVPEALSGGALGAVRTGDWIYLDASHGELQVVSRARNQSGFKVIPTRELLNRPDRKKRIHELERRRLEMMPSFRVVLDCISTADSGVSPAVK
jgi:dihydroxy-acid dehydratase